MKNIVTFAIEAKKYLFAVLLLIGTSVCAWGGLTISQSTIEVTISKAEAENGKNIATITITGSNLYQDGTPYWILYDGTNMELSNTGKPYGTTDFTQNVTIYFLADAIGDYTDQIYVYSYDASGNAIVTGNTVDITVHVVSNVTTYQVTFNAGSGNTLVAGTSDISGDGQQTGNITTASMSVLPTATPCATAVTAGWSFDGWHQGAVPASSTSYSNKITTPYVPTSATTLNAVYTMKGSTMTSVTLTQQTVTMPAAGQYIALTQMSNAETAISNTTVTNHQSLKKVPGGDNCSYSNNTLTSTNSNVVYELVDAGTYGGNQYYYLRNIVSGKYLASTDNDKELTFVTSTNDHAKWRFIAASTMFYVMNKSRTGYLYWDSTNSYWECRDKASQPTQNQWQVQVYSASPSSFTIPTYYQSALDCSVKYHVTYAAGCDMAEITSGSVPIDNTAYNNGEWVTAAANTLVRPGYTFNGWLNSVSGYLVYPGGDPDGFYISADVTLTAQWTAAPNTLTIASPNDVTIRATSPSVEEGGSTTVNTGTTVTLSYSNVTGGYAWAGWKVYKTGDQTTTVSVDGNNQFTMPNYNVTVDASLYQKSKLKTRCQAEVEFTIEGSVYLTSYAAVPVYTTDNPDNRITVTCADWGEADHLYISYIDGSGNTIAKGSSLFRLCDGSTYTVMDGTNDFISISGTSHASGVKYAISYTPVGTSGSEEYNQIDNWKLRLTAKKGTSTELGHQDIAINGRALPQKFVIAANIGGQWRALPADLATSAGTTVQDAYIIQVDNLSTPTSAIAPKTAIYSAEARPRPMSNRGGVRLHTETGSSDGYLQAPRSNAEGRTYLWRTTSDCSTGMQTWYLKSNDLVVYDYIGVDPNIVVSAGSGNGEEEGNGSDPINRYLCVYGNQIMWTNSETPSHRQFRILPATEYTLKDVQVVEWASDKIRFMYLGDPNHEVEVKIDNVTKASTAELSTLKIDKGVYEIAVSDLMTSAYKPMHIILKNSGTEVGRKQVMVPLMVNTGTTIVDAAEGFTKGTQCPQMDLIVLPSGKLTATYGESEAAFQFKTVSVYGGGKLIIAANKGLIVRDSMILRAGSVNVTKKGEDYSTSYIYSFPQVYIGSGATLTVPSNTMYFDYLTTKNQYYALAMPYGTTINKTNIFYPEDIYGSYKTGSYLMDAFNSATRASQGAVDAVWDDKENVVPTRGLGYYFLGMPRKMSINGGTAERQEYGIQRIKMNVTNASTLATNENTNASISLKYEVSNQVYNAGWNLLGSPFMADMTTGNTDGMTDNGGDNNVIYGNLTFSDNKWGIDKTVRYVTVPNDEAMETYDQRLVKDYTFPAFKTFYVQIGKNGTITFDQSRRSNEAPARLLMANKKPQEIEFSIALNPEAGAGDTTHLLLGDAFSEDYEIGDDMVKMSHAGVSLFTIMKGNDLFANAIPAAIALNGIPVGYNAPASGEMIFSINDKDDYTWIEHVWLTDYDKNTKTDLLVEEYPFTTDVGENRTRFALNVELKAEEDISSNVEQIEDVEAVDGPIKFIYQDKMYILNRGVIYDATGKRVREINK